MKNDYREKILYVCYERGCYEGLDYYGWFNSDIEAVREFKKQINQGMGNKAEWYVGRLNHFDDVTLGLSNKTTEVRIFKTTYNKDWEIGDT